MGESRPKPQSVYCLAIFHPHFMIKLFPFSVSSVLQFFSVLPKQISTTERQRESKIEFLLMIKENQILFRKGDRQWKRILKFPSCHWRVLLKSMKADHIVIELWMHCFTADGNVQAQKSSPSSSLNQQIKLILLFYGLLTQIKSNKIYVNPHTLSLSLIDRLEFLPEWLRLWKNQIIWQAVVC